MALRVTVQRCYAMHLLCFCSDLQCITAFLYSGYSPEAFSVLQVQHQAVGTEVHFVLGLCHLEEGQTDNTTLGSGESGHMTSQ